MKPFIIALFCSLIFTGHDPYAQKLNDFRLIDKHSSHSESFFIYNNIYKDTTDECDINLNNSILLKNVRIIDSGDSSFTITKNDVDKSFSISDINSIKFIHHGFAKGMIYGLLASTVFWGVLGLTLPHSSEGWNIGGFGFIIGFVLGIPTGLVTGMITEFATSDDVYDFGNANASAKAKRLRYIMSKQ